MHLDAFQKIVLGLKERQILNHCIEDTVRNHPNAKERKEHRRCQYVSASGELK